MYVGVSIDLRIYVAVTSPYPWNRGVTMSPVYLVILLDICYTPCGNTLLMYVYHALSCTLILVVLNA